MMDAMKARAQSECAAKVLADEERRVKDMALAEGQMVRVESLKDYVILCFEDKVNDAIKAGATRASDWWPCDEHAMWMGIMQDITPFFLSRGYKVVGLRLKTNDMAQFNITVSW